MFQNICNIIISVLFFSEKRQNYHALCKTEMITLLSRKQQILVSSVLVEIGGKMFFQKRKVPLPFSSDYLFSIPCLCFSLEYENIHGNIQAFV